MLTIEPIKAFDDNYIWCIYDLNSRQAIVVDPGDAGPVDRFLTAKELSLSDILITHHHYDHTHGVTELKRQHNSTVFGPKNPQIAGIDHALSHLDEITVLGINFQIIATPGHTLDHIPSVFCGDTLFAAGCGRIFEGTAVMLHQSLQQLAALPSNTRVYCTHEYTMANLEFAQAVEPNNQQLSERITAESLKRSQLQPTLPSTMALELMTNPFLRSHIPEVIASAQQQGQRCETPLEVFTAIREWKNHF